MAANARAAASSAALTAQSARESGNFVNIDGARAAQTRASIAQSHAIHAAVVEHEAKTIKRRATLALANDVKVWNVHRKREMLLSSIGYARAQHEATRRAVDAWSSLRDGFVGSLMISPTADRRSSCGDRHAVALSEQSESMATIYEAEATIIATEHPLLAGAHTPTVNAQAEDHAEKDALDFGSCLIGSEEPVLPFAAASPIFGENVDGSWTRQCLSDIDSGKMDPFSNSILAGHDSSGVGDDAMSASMQSLVDGLMLWGGGLDAEEDHFALPQGMAASIVMERRMMG